MGRSGAVVVAPCVLGLALLAGFAEPQASTDPSLVFEKIEAMVPMRDGVRLNTEVYVPKNTKEPLPILVTRTPYGLEHDAKGMSPDLGGAYKELARDGYIFLYQDIRGRNKSEGQFVMLRNPRDKGDPKAVDEGSDTYDTIEWALKTVPGHNGKVGVLGVSYGGWLTVMAMLDPHPAVKAVSPQASPADMYIGDDFHHNGAFRLSYGFEYVYMLETGKENENFRFDEYDTYEWYLHMGALSKVNPAYFHGTRPTWNDFAAHPNYDAFWKRQAVAPYLTRVTVPTLNVAGWWDQEDFYGPLKIYEALEKVDTEHRNFLVVGPWNHGGWYAEEGQKLGRIDFGSATSRYFREEVQAKWFAHHLKGKGASDMPEALTFESGSNTWQRHEAWPPKTSAPRRLYFRAGGVLSFDAPSDDGPQEQDAFVSDPAHPVPYRARPIEPTYPGPGWPVWLLEDQRFVHHRPDVLSWESATLTDDVVVAGDITARLFASTTGTDADWVAKLIDVYPEDYAREPNMAGYQLMVANDVIRGRFRKSLEKPEPVPANEVVEYAIDMHANDHRFLKGHRIMAQVQSTWFPIIDRNPQKYVPNIFEAKDSDFQAATHRIYRSKSRPSHIEVAVAKP